MTGFFCMDTCPQGTYGPGCSNTCNCNKGTCHHVTGQCQCPGGWTGDTCDQACPVGSYGPDCDHQCYCHNSATCHPVDGKCKCPPGFSGNLCEDTCPEHFYGESCFNRCECGSDNYLCHPVVGCMCQPRYTGDNCSTPLPIYTQYPYTTAPVGPEAGSEGSLFAGLIIGSIALVSIVVFFVIWFRRRYNNLKSRHTTGYYSESGN